MANVGSAEWKALTDAYVAEQEKAAANGWKGWEHASCDHAYGYCAATAGNYYGGG